MDKKDDLYIPVNVPSIELVISGYGKKELTIVVLLVIIGLGVGLTNFIATKSVITTLLPPAILGAGSAFLLVRDRYCENMIDKLKYVFLYLKDQKEYEYKYVNIYENVKEDAE